MAFTVSSTSFPNGGDIPKKFTCDDADVSPELSWNGAPSGTQAYALIADDPDAPAGTWTHWVLFNIPASTTSLPEGVSKVDELPGGERQGPRRRTPGSQRFSQDWLQRSLSTAGKASSLFLQTLCAEVET